MPEAEDCQHDWKAIRYLYGGLYAMLRCSKCDAVCMSKELPNSMTEYGAPIVRKTNA